MDIVYGKHMAFGLGLSLGENRTLLWLSRNPPDNIEGGVLS